MSNIGKKPVYSSRNIKIQVRFPNFVIITNTQTKLALKVKINAPLLVRLTQKNSQQKLNLLATSTSRKVFALWGTLQRCFTNTIKGLYTLHKLKFKFVGVGYKANLKKNFLVLRLGYSHKLFCTIPKTVSFIKTKKRPPTFLLKSHDLDLIKRTAFLIRSFKRPEPYKGKGIVLLNEFLKLKESKKK